MSSKLNGHSKIELKGTRIVIPKNKHNQILKMRHEGHLGLGKCKLWVKTLYIGQELMNT